VATAAAVPFIDVDSHITEPADLWTSRISSKNAEYAPRVIADPASGRPRWQIGKHLSFFVTELNHAGWPEFYPSAPPDYSEADPGGWDPAVRLKKLDENGITAQVLYPNVIAFHSYAFMGMERNAGLECVRVYNDFQAEFASTDPKRFLPQMFLPFWDVGAAMAEMARCREMGHKGINFGVETQRMGLPPLSDDRWTPLLAQAQDLDLPINFHIGFSMRTADEMEKRMASQRADELTWAKNVAMQFMGNGQGICEIIMGGICHRFPRLDFVSVESGFGYVPFLLESLDWQFRGMSCDRIHPDWLLPSEYFRRQVYASFWFETGIARQIDLYPDNLMFETDYPHPTSLSPGEGSYAKSPQDVIRENLAGLTEEQRRKVLYDTAAKVYRLGS
jgi:predicted TIM-barrel fold metal-dependent hydrolase